MSTSTINFRSFWSNIFHTSSQSHRPNSTYNNRADFLAFRARMEALEKERDDAVHRVLSETDREKSENPVSFQEAFISAFSSDGVDQSFITQLGGLAKTVIGLQNNFKTVGLILDLLYSRPVFKTFKLEWASYSEKYTSLLWESKRFAGVIRSRVEEYSEVILPTLQCKTTTVEEKIKCLDFFLNKPKSIYESPAENDEQKAERMAREFTKLANDVVRFGARLQTAIKAAKIPVDTRVKELQSQVDDIISRLTELENHDRSDRAIIRVFNVIGSGMVGCGTAMIATGNLAPVGIILQIIGAFLIAGCRIASEIHLNRIAQCELKLAQAEAEYNDVADEAEFMGELSRTTEATISDMDGQLNAFVGIWTCVQQDAQAARLQLNSAATGFNSEIPEVLQDGYNKLATKCYQRLGYGLKAYAAGFENLKSES